MSTSAILPISASLALSDPPSVDYNSPTATSAQQSVFNGLLNQLQQSVGVGDLPASQTLLTAVQALSPSASNGSSPLATFLTNLTNAISNNSASQAQAALTTYQNAVPSTTFASTAPANPTANPSVVAAQIAASLIQSQNQLLLVNSLIGPNSSLGSNSGGATSSSNSASSLIGILNAAYPATGSSSSSGSSTTATSATEAATSGTPYDALVSSIQASLAAGNGTITPALAYLQAAGNFVNTSA